MRTATAAVIADGDVGDDANTGAPRNSNANINRCDVNGSVQSRHVKLALRAASSAEGASNWSNRALGSRTLAHATEPSGRTSTWMWMSPLTIAAWATGG